MEVRVKVKVLGCLGDCQGTGPARAGLGVSSTVRRVGQAHLILLLEAIALGCLHLIDVLQKIRHAHCGVKLPRVIRGALPAACAPRRTPQEAAGLRDTTASLVSCKKGKGLSHICILRLRHPWSQGAQPTWRVAGPFLRVKLSMAAQG